MQNLKIDILGCSEVRWPNSGRTVIDNYVFYYSGDNTTQNRNGVAIVINKDTERSVKGFIPITERIALLKLNATPCNINIITAYAPTSESTEEEIDKFYTELDKTLKETKKEELNVILGDFNAKVGKGIDGEVVGEFGLGTRNERGEKLVQFCKDNELIIKNTWYQLPARRIYTWKAPRDDGENITRNQIDYIIINQRFRNAIVSAKTYPGADIESDHNLVLADMKLKLKKIKTTTKSTRINLRRLKEPDLCQQIKEQIHKEVQKVEEQGQLNATGKWRELEKILRNIIKHQLEDNTAPKSKEWITQEIKELISERRKFKNRNEQQYKNVNKTIKQKIKEAKELGLSEKCAEIERLEKQHDTFNIHRKIKEAAGIYKKKDIGNIMDKNNKIIIESAEKLNRWEEYIKELFEDDEKMETIEPRGRNGPAITKDEIEKALKCIKDNKAMGPDEIPTEILKILTENHIDLLVELFNEIYDTGEIPKEWLISEFIPIPKKPNAMKCEEYRTISLMNHILKVFLRVIHERVYKKLDDRIAENQLGFRKGFGTREALFTVQTLIERCRDVNCEVFICLVDFEKAFDKIQHRRLANILRNTEIDDKDVRIITNLYQYQKAIIRVDQQKSKEIPIRRGVRQGCVLSPILFNMCSEEMFKEALEEVNEGISINGKLVNNLRYADDTILLADSREGLQILVDKTTQYCEKYGMALNTKKTKIMIVSKNKIEDDRVHVKGRVLERVSKYNYLGCELNEQWDRSFEIRRRIEIARSAFNRMKAILCSGKLGIEIRTRVLRCYVFSVLLYGVEAWTITDATEKRLASFEMWCYRRMWKISWTQHVTNKETLRRMKKETEILNTIKERKMSYFGHILRGDKYELMRLVVQGKVEGKRGPGRRRTSWLKNLRQWSGKTSIELFRTAADRIKWAMMIANVLKG